MADTTKEFSWRNVAGLTIQGVEWPVGSPRGVVGLIHGIGEHARRYDHLAAYFNEQRYAVLSYDREGHGKSEGQRGHAKDYKLFVDEAARLLQECGKRYPGAPVFMYGHSMGGQVLLRYLIRRRPNIAGAVVSAPHIRLPFRPNPIQIALGKLMRKIKPSFSQPTPLKLELLSRSPHISGEYERDPLVHSLVSAEIGLSLLENAAAIDGWRGELTVPTLLMHGDADGITDHGGSASFAERNPALVTFQSWAGLYHELHNEPEWKDVARFVVDWLNERLPPSQQ